MKLMSPHLRDPAETNQAPREAPQPGVAGGGVAGGGGVGRRHVAPGGLLMLCVSSPVYAAGKAATSGVPSIYAPSTYAHLSPAKTPAMIPMGPLYNGYSGDFDRNSSGEVGGSQEQLGQGLGWVFGH